MSIGLIWLTINTNDNVYVIPYTRGLEGQVCACRTRWRPPGADRLQLRGPKWTLAYDCST